MLFGIVGGCASQSSQWRSRTQVELDILAAQNAPRLFPQEYSSIVETFEHGEAVLQVKKKVEQADAYYQLALQKAETLKGELRRLRERRAEEERRRLAELAIRAEEERLMREAAEAETRLREQERIRQEEEQRRAISEQSRSARVTPKERVVPQPAFYTVRRGETLPQIAARSEIYNDASLWTLIYRANRDQIRDPKRLWPGQVLSIPRNSTRETMNTPRRSTVKP